MPEIAKNTVNIAKNKILFKVHLHIRPVGLSISEPSLLNYIITRELTDSQAGLAHTRPVLVCLRNF